MAKAAWLSLTPASGSGKQNITNSAPAYKGRLARTSTQEVEAEGVTESVTYEVEQEGAGELVSFNDGISASAGKEASKLTVKGRSNSTALTFSWVGESSGVSIPTTYTAGGKSTNNGAAIAGDPGATGDYEFAVVLDIPLNDTVAAVTRKLKVTAADGAYAQINIVQTAGTPRLSVTPTKVTISAAGGSATVVIDSNTQWTIS